MFKPESNTRAEKEIILDDICADMRKGLPLGVSKLKKALMSAHVDVNDVDETGCSLLLAACQGGLLEAARDLLARGADVDWVDENSVSALHVAMLFEHAPVVKLLIAKGANLDAKTKAGEKPGQLSMGRIITQIFEACKEGDVNVVLNMLGRNWIPVDLREEDAENKDLHAAIIQERRERRDRPGSRAKILSPSNSQSLSQTFDEIRMSPKMEKVPEGGMSPRDQPKQAADTAVQPDPEASDGESVKGGDAGQEGGQAGEPEKKKPTRRTLLMYAAENGMTKVVKSLVRMRANISLLDSDGLGAQTLAFNAGYNEIAQYLNSKVPENERVELPVEKDSMTVLQDLFFSFCAMGTQTLGISGARTGRTGTGDKPSASRDATMDFAEFQKILANLDLFGPDKPVTKSVAAETFQAVNKVSSESGELHWIDFKDCLFRIGERFEMETVADVPIEELKVERGGAKQARVKGMDKVPYCSMSKSLMERELEWMQRQLQAIADRTKDVTSCSFAAYGHGVTTGNHKLRPETLNIYRSLLRVPGERLAVPALDKPKEVRKKEMMAKSFFNTIDKDHSGSLTRYELQWALDDYGFERDEQDEVFRLVDSDNSGSVTLPEFIKGMNEGNVNFAGRTSRSRKTKTYLDIGLRLSKAVNQKQNPIKILSISPGLFGQIFKIYSDYAMMDRLGSFEESSCVFRAPKLSAVASPVKSVSKSPTGINTRFAVVNPFDPRVLAASSPNASLDQSHEQSRRSPTGDESHSSSPKRRPASVASAAASSPTRSTTTSPFPSRVQTPVQTGQVHYRRQILALKDTIRRPKTSKDDLKESPDGKLLSEHTRITLIPHRLTITESGQLLVGGVTGLSDGKAEPSLAQLAVKKHRLTKAGLALLRRVVFRSLSMGAGHCAAVTDTGLVFTWGQGRYGQLGHGDSLDKIVPQPVQGISGEIKIVSAGFYHTLSVTKSGSLYTWGDGKEGKLGHNDDATRLLPTLVSEFMDRGIFIRTAQAGGSHTAALSGDLQVYTFGAGGSGRLGHGNDKMQWLPLLVSALELQHVVSIAAGFAHTVALTLDGDIYTWGSGRMGRLGHGSESDEVLPRKVALVANATVKPVAVAAGEAHTCLFRSDGSMVTLGRLTHGRIAEGSCIQDSSGDVRAALAMQSADDWHHFAT